MELVPKVDYIHTRSNSIRPCSIDCSDVTFTDGQTDKKQAYFREVAPCSSGTRFSCCIRGVYNHVFTYTSNTHTHTHTYICNINDIHNCCKHGLEWCILHQIECSTAGMTGLVTRATLYCGNAWQASRLEPPRRHRPCSCIM